MVSAPVWLPDWRDVGAYRFERFDRAGFAWEWLRRDPGYRDAALTALDSGGEGAATADAAAWGLVAFERAELSACEARPLWRADTDRQVLVADAIDGDVDGAEAGNMDADVFALDRLGDFATIVTSADADHILLSDCWRRLRIDVFPAGRTGRPLMPRWRLGGVRSLGPQLLALRRLMSVVRNHRFGTRLWPRDSRTRRWILALRAHDALVAGAGHREVAGLFGGDTGARWRVNDLSGRLQAQRLAVLARSLAGRAFADRFLG